MSLHPEEERTAGGTILTNSMHFLTRYQWYLEHQNLDETHATYQAHNPTTDPPIDFGKLPDLLINVAKQITAYEMEGLMIHLKLRAFLEKFQEIPRIITLLETLDRVVIKECVESGVSHEYAEEAKCTMCQTQLCKDCYHCILRDCESISSTELNTKSKGEGWDRKDSLAVQRVLAACEACYPLLEHASKFETKACNCTEFIMANQGQHLCAQGNGHHCESCFKGLHRYLTGMRPPTRLRAYELPWSTEEHLEQYKCCFCQEDWHPNVPPICRICMGACALPIVNDTASPYIDVVNSGREKEGEFNNQGVCYHFFRGNGNDGTGSGS